MNSQFSRREFLTGFLGIAGGLTTFSFFNKLPRVGTIPGKICGAPYQVGHLLRDGKIPPFSRTIQTEVVIVGGGMAGLSAAWKLQKSGFDDFILFELDSDVGGNARSGKNAISAYPWGAHYVPLPGPNARAVRELFEELGVIEGYNELNLPKYNEYYLCAAPQERLYIHGRWQEGLYPLSGSSAKDKIQYKQFSDRMKAFKKAIGKDNRPAFSIPIEYSSQDETYLKYDRISMGDYLDQMGWNSEPLRWYVNYGCRDDYGSNLQNTSAWAGIHYFAARTGEGVDLEEPVVLTWPEGNGWIVKQLKGRLTSHIQRDYLVFNIEKEGTLTVLDVYDAVSKTTTRAKAKAVIYAAPKYTAQHTIADFRRNPPPYYQEFKYAPWMVANITLNSLPVGRGMPLSWDNVFYDSPSLGYVVATHENLEMSPRQTVITYYYPFCYHDPSDTRKEILQYTHKDWTRLIIQDLSRVHSEIESQIENIDVWIWGHGMIRPHPGFIWGSERKAACQPYQNIEFAHSDQSGISIFEEAQFRGVKAAETVMNRFKHSFVSSL